MYLYSLFSNLPFWGVFLFTVFVTMLAFALGFQWGLRKSDSLSGRESQVGSIIGATLGLLAFILAFTFSLAATRFEERRSLVLEEANAIRTAYLRAGYLEDPYKSDIRKLLRDYLKSRLEGILSQNVSEVLSVSDRLQDELWRQTTQVALKNPNTEVVSLYIDSVNDVINIHAKRVLGSLYARIPIIIWGSLFLILFVSIGALGYITGAEKNKVILVSCILIFTLAVVITMIHDLDSPQEGFLKVSQQSEIDLLNRIDSGKIP